MAIIELHSELFILRGAAAQTWYSWQQTSPKHTHRLRRGLFLAVTWRPSATPVFSTASAMGLLARRTWGHASLVLGQGCASIYSCSSKTLQRLPSALFTFGFFTLTHGAFFQLHPKSAAASIPFCLAILTGWRFSTGGLSAAVNIFD